LKFRIFNLSPDGNAFLLSEFKAKRLQLAAFLAFSLVAALIEMAGIGLVFPLLILIVDPSSLAKTPVLGEALARFEIVPGPSLSIALLVLIGVLMIGKNGYMLAFHWLQVNTLAKWKSELARRLMRIYLFSNYRVHLSKTSSEIIRNMSLVSTIFDQFVSALINICVNTIILASLCVLLVLVIPSEALFGFVVLGAVATGLYFAMHRPLSDIGGELNSLFEKRQSILRQAIGMIKETKLSSKEAFFLDAYVAVEKRNFFRTARYNFLSTVSPLAIEGAVIASILGIVAYLLFFSPQREIGLALLGVLAATLFRLIPILNRMMVSLQVLSLSRNAVDIIGAELAALEANVFAPAIEPKPLPFADRIEFDDVAFAYPGTERAALLPVSFGISKGEMIGITGPSGAGKTTLAALLMGLVSPASGHIRVDGLPLDGKSRLRAWSKNIGYVPQSIFLVEDSVLQNVVFGVGADRVDVARVWNALETAQLKSFVESLPKQLDEAIGEDGSRLSGGQRQRLGIARALYEDREMIVLDEATSNLDARSESEFGRALSRMRASRTLVVIAHRLSTLRSCDRIIVMDAGRILDIGSFEELNGRCALFQRLVELSRLDKAPG